MRHGAIQLNPRLTNNDGESVSWKRITELMVNSVNGKVKIRKEDLGLLGKLFKIEKTAVWEVISIIYAPPCERHWKFNYFFQFNLPLPESSTSYPARHIWSLPNHFRFHLSPTNRISKSHPQITGKLQNPSHNLLVNKLFHSSSAHHYQVSLSVCLHNPTCGFLEDNL